MVCQMIKAKTFGTDLIGITIWNAEPFLKCIELNTFIINLHFSADTYGQLKISIGLINYIYFGFSIETRSGA